MDQPVPKEEDGARHRGRVQAQGAGIEESIPWAQAAPPTVTDGHGMLNDLRARLISSEQQYRELAFTQAREFVDRAGHTRGVSAPVKKSFPYPPRRDRRRVDVEVIKGLAFVPDV